MLFLVVKDAAESEGGDVVGIFFGVEFISFL